VAIQVYLQEEDYRCLVKHAGANSSMHSALAGALPLSTAGAKSTWKVLCDALDVVRLLRLAHELCPEAVPDIRRSMTIFLASASVIARVETMSSSSVTGLRLSSCAIASPI
jgi:hypothetical protein